MSFAPWIAIWIVGGHNHMRLAAGLALGACVGLTAREYLAGLRPKSLDWGTLAIIAVLLVIALVAPQSWSNKWFVPVANGALFALMLGTILVGKPFAVEYGKKSGATRGMGEQLPFARQRSESRSYGPLRSVRFSQVPLSQL